MALNTPDEHVHRAVISCFMRTFNLGHARIQGYSLAGFDGGHEVILELWSIYIVGILHLRCELLVSLVGVDCTLAFDETWLCQIQIQR